MSTITDISREVIVGVDTHKDFHVAAAIDLNGKILDVCRIKTDRAGFKRLLKWSKTLGLIQCFGVEGTGSYGATLGQFLADQGFDVVEVNRPNRQRRRRLGKSDPVDAEAAARAVLSGDATAKPKSKDGNVEMIRVLRVARKSAIKARAQATNQIRHLLVTAPESIRASLEPLRIQTLVATVAQMRPGHVCTIEAATKFSLRSLGRRWQELDREISELDARLDSLVELVAPTLAEVFGVGTDVAGALLVAAGDNPERLRSDASFAALCGASPVEASSGKTTRHRLNRGGDRTANNALWRIVLVRMSRDQRTRDYVLRRTQEGRSKKEVIRCLKRYVAREIYGALMLDIGSERLAA